MEIPARLYFPFWAAVGFIFLQIGFESSGNSGFSDSVSPVVMCLFGHSLAISIYHSSIYAIIFRRLPNSTLLDLKEIMNIYRFASFHVLTIFYTTNFFDSSTESKFSFFLWQFSFHLWIILLAGLFEYANNRFAIQRYPVYFGVILGNFEYIFFSVWSRQFSIYNGKTKIFPVLIFTVSCFSSVLWAKYFSHVEHENHGMIGMNKKKKFINFAVGAAGTILFQYFFELTSFDHVKVFLYYTIVWLANIALLRPSCGDFGIFTFLLMNMIVGCTVSQFGISGTTWLAYGASVFLHGLRLIVESLPLVNRRGTEVLVINVREIF